MRVIRDPGYLSRVAAAEKRSGRRIGLVPTMGALHAGHISLLRRCRRENEISIVSIFVNPAQFAPDEDFRRYPRPLARDISFCRREKCDLLFCPSAADMYPRGYSTYVNVEGLGDELCGQLRQGHFRGVATVVAKLFHIVSPDCAYFGQKDAQQAAVIRRMVKDLDFGVRVKVSATVREPDGLAMSSRNVYLTPLERRQAVVLYQALKKARTLILEGKKRDCGQIIRSIRSSISRASEARIDYVAVVSADDLAPLKKISGRCLIAVALRFKKARLIDNIIVKVPAREPLVTNH